MKQSSNVKAFSTTAKTGGTGNSQHKTALGYGFVKAQFSIPNQALANSVHHNQIVDDAVILSNFSCCGETVRETVAPASLNLNSKQLAWL